VLDLTTFEEQNARNTKMKSRIPVILLVISLIGNVVLGCGLIYDETQIAKANLQIAKANAARMQAYNDYRQRLIDLRTEHPIIFKNLKIPPPLNESDNR
jgi:hypothetical protein